MKRNIFYSILITNLICYLLFYLPLKEPILLFTWNSILLSVLFIIIVIFIKKYDIIKNSLKYLILLGIIYRVILIPIQPIASDDFYRYIWDGKVQANGINPYTYAPNDSTLKHLHSEQLPSKVNFQHLKTIYPPYSQWIFLFAYIIAGESFLGLKLLLLITEILTIIFIFLTLKNLNKDQKYTLIYALSPLPIMQFFIDAHVDGFGITLFAAFFYLVSKNKWLYSYFVLGLSITSKLITIMIYPFLLRGRSIKNFMALIIVPSITVCLIYVPYSINGFPFESLLIFVQNWYSNASVFTLFQKIFNDNFLSRIFSMALFFVSFVWLYFSKKELIEKSYLIFTLFFIFSPVVHPWYITWVAFLTAINFRWSGVVFISTISISNIYAMNYIINKKWEMNEWLLLFEYLPVIILLAIEEIRLKRKNLNLELS
ncbi:MAG: hypothetical protein NZM09_10105 [Ignavibacterium sp.]|nr:hypothetical protein [Ignavibacterium sp.]MDW8376031.1 hypothetical protein [Ignavibacteriales bacterium]